MVYEPRSLTFQGEVAHKLAYAINSMGTDDNDDIDLRKLEILNKIFLDAAKNPEFRSRLLDDPRDALSSYDIPEDLKDMLVRMIQEKEQI